MGEVGTGKTTVSQRAINVWKAPPEKYVIGQVIEASPQMPAAFLRNVLVSLDLPPKRNVLDLKATLRLFLVAEYKNRRTVVLLINEAQKIHSANLDAIHAKVGVGVCKFSAGGIECGGVCRRVGGRAGYDAGAGN